MHWMNAISTRCKEGIDSVRLTAFRFVSLRHCGAGRPLRQFWKIFLPMRSQKRELSWSKKLSRITVHISIRGSSTSCACCLAHRSFAFCTQKVLTVISCWSVSRLHSICWVLCPFLVIKCSPVKFLERFLLWFACLFCFCLKGCQTKLFEFRKLMIILLLNLAQSYTLRTDLRGTVDATC